MSTSHFVKAHPKTGWRIDPPTFAEALQTKWPYAKLKPIHDPRQNYILEWSICWEDGSGFDGLLERDLQSVALSGGGAGIEECAEFAVWLQQLYPEATNLLFFDEQLSFDVDLAGRTVEEVVQLANQGYSFLRPELNSPEVPQKTL